MEIMLLAFIIMNFKQAILRIIQFKIFLKV